MVDFYFKANKKSYLEIRLYGGPAVFIIQWVRKYWYNILIYDKLWGRALVKFYENCAENLREQSQVCHTENESALDFNEVKDVLHRGGSGGSGGGDGEGGVVLNIRCW